MYICENKKTMTEARKQYHKQWRLANKERLKQYDLDNKDKKKEYNKQYRLDNKETRKQYQLENKERLKEYQLENKENLKEYRLENKERIKEYSKDYRLNNNEKIKEYRLNNKENLKEYSKEYRLNNKGKRNKYHNNRRKNDPLFRIIGNIRTSIRSSFKNKGYTKKTNTYKILGCEYNVFAEWLNISNYNEDSHLDHVVPISLANTEEEVLLLNHYSNFQILTSIENITKGNRYINNDNLQRVLNNHTQPSVIQKIVNRSNIEIKNP